MKNFLVIRHILTVSVILLLSPVAHGQEQPPALIEGRWDLVVEKDGKQLPSWLEVEHSGNHTLVGRFCYAFGSARPISVVHFKDGGKFDFSIPPQWEQGTRNMDFEGTVTVDENGGDKIKGSMIYVDDKTYTFTGVRAPLLREKGEPSWSSPVPLLNGKDLKGWHALGENQWVVEGGILKSARSGSNLVSDQTFADFKLHIEFRYQKGSNSGVYLRGRYETQILDSKGKEPWVGFFGAIYGFLTPSAMVAKDPGEWQSYDIALVGRTVTLVANGITIICNQQIPGITGGAIDSKEGEPGPIMLQGDHGPIDFRNITISTPK